jgi:hypothetical protein
MLQISLQNVTKKLLQISLQKLKNVTDFITKILQISLQKLLTSLQKCYKFHYKSYSLHYKNVTNFITKSY